ncbi:hypothetical protein GO495_25305 [Chitinophaga oryziterrae]|uniref:BZIP transcription factor n=1 Tax=Chitinophaga oryziterrae TaxID=1031224 RepID=A0A6N8JI38_9BACT|nr:hypothetical protein [Chitinophaga oryziterrae]MVT43938.1 hypothetical protein [Chitinophaga oryziterrae]
MKKFVFPFIVLAFFKIQSVSAQQTLFPNPIAIGPGVTAVDPNIPMLVTGISRFNAMSQFGDAPDNTSYGKGIQISRVASQPDNLFHLSFIRSGSCVVGMGYLQNSNTFALQSTPNNAGANGFFMLQNGFNGINTSTPLQALDINGNASIRGNYVYLNSGASLFSNVDNIALFTDGGYVFGNKDNSKTRAIITSAGSLFLYNTTANTVSVRVNSVGDSYFNAGSVAIGTTTPGEYKLAVKGTIGAMRLKVTQTWADFVFDSAYQLPTLEEVALHVKTYKHLPGIPSEKEIAEKGLDVGEMQQKQMQKIEELTLYMIELKKQLAIQQELIAEQRKELDALKK